MIDTSPSIGCVIPTYNAEKHLHRLLPPLMQSKLKIRILIIDSSSEDKTLEIAQAFGVEIVSIPKLEFNHGTTRELGRQYLSCDIIIMMTQDAYLTDPQALDLLLQPIVLGSAAATYARQIPHHNASFFAAFAREFNYPAKGELRSLADLSKYGMYTFFCSNSCAAYCNKKLDEINGFSDVILGEDTVAVAQLLKRGYRVAYVAKALVHHSHNYTLKEEFLRSYQTGMARTSYAHLIQGGNNDLQRGKKYAKEMLRYLAGSAPYLIPYAILHLFVRWLGYRLGKRSLKFLIER